MPRVLIIGAGFAGLECAKKLAGREEFQVTIIDRQNHHLFQPLLYQVASASLSAPDIARSIRQILADAKNVTVLMDEIISVDAKGNHATGNSGKTYEYDYLVLACGARTGYFGNDHWAEHTYSLKSLAEAQNIRRQVLENLERAEMCDDEERRKMLMTIAIIGGGPTGVELAGAFAELTRKSLQSNYRHIDTSKLRIILIESSPRILEAYSEEQSEYGRKRLQSLGVEVMTGNRVKEITPQTLLLNSGEVIKAGSIIWAAGVAASPLPAGITTPADRAGRIAPQPDLSLTEFPNIFVTGDIVSMKQENGEPIPGIAPAAMQMGRHVAAVLIEENRLAKTQFTGREKSLRPRFIYQDKGYMAVIGKNHAVVKSGNLQVQGFLAWLMWLFIHIMYLVGFSNRFHVMLSWAFAYLRDNPSARVIVRPLLTKNHE